MNDKRRPPSLHRGPAPEGPEPEKPGCRRATFYFDQGGDVSTTIDDAAIASLEEFTTQAWGGVGGQTYIITSEDGTPKVLVNLSKVRLVEIR